MLGTEVEHHVTPEVQVIPIGQVNEAFDRIVDGDVRFRFVIDNVTLPQAGGSRLSACTFCCAGETP